MPTLHDPGSRNDKINRMENVLFKLICTINKCICHIDIKIRQKWIMKSNAQNAIFMAV